MAHVVSGKLRKAPFIKEGCGQGDSTMFVVELSEMVKDWQTQEKQYANYKAMFFAKTDGAKEFYHKAFAEGSFVVVSCEKLKVDTFAADNGSTYVTLNMDNPRLESALPVSDMGAPQQQQQGGWGQPQQPAQQQYNAPNQQPQQQAPHQPQQQYNEPPMDFDDNIPFAPVGLQYGRNFIHSI